VRLKFLLVGSLLAYAASSFALLARASWVIPNARGKEPMTSVTQAPSTRQTNKQLPAAIMKLFRIEWGGMNSNDCQINPDKDFRFSRVDLNGDGIAELLVSSTAPCLCSPTGNCYFDVYRVTRSRLQTILHDDSIQSYKVLTTRTKGYFDISTYVHGSAFDGDLKIWKFDGKQYQIAECFDQTYSYIDENGEQHILKEPRKTRVPCRGN
jgi:hypothetical protein